MTYPPQQGPGQPYPPRQPYQPQQPLPPRPPQRSSGQKVLIGIAIAVGVLIAFGVVGAVLGGGDETDTPGAAPSAPLTAPPTPAADAADEKDRKPADKPDDKSAAEPKEDKPEAPPKVVFKVWGEAPDGVDIMYGSDSDSRQGGGLPMETTLKLNDDALYYHVNAQLMGGGDINCSVTIDGQTKKAHASGGYNICNAQLNADFLGGWS